MQCGEEHVKWDWYGQDRVEQEDDKTGLRWVKVDETG